MGDGVPDTAMNNLNQFPQPNMPQPEPQWFQRRQIALLMILVGLALFIWSL